MRTVTRWLALLSIVLAAPLANAAPDGAPAGGDDQAKIRSLIHRADRVLRGKTSAAVVSMRIKTTDYDRSYDMVIWDDSRDTSKALVKILGPALWRGHGTLKVGDRLLTYNPRNDHVTVVGSSMLGDSWMGSHFSNDDLVKETELDTDYDPSIEKEWDAPAEEGGEPVHWYLLKLKPKPRAPVVWGAIHMTLYETGDRVIPHTMKYFREDAPEAKVSRTLTFSGVKKLGGRLVPSRMRMEVTDKPGEFTELVYKELRFDVAIPGDKFTERALRQ